MEKALLLLEPKELSERNKRLKRALDMGLKRTVLAEHAQVQARQDVYKPYLALDFVRNERLERESYRA